MGVLKIRGKWGYELYDENGKCVRKVVEKQDGPKPKEGWYEVAKKAHRNACGARDKGEPLPFTTSRKTFREIAKKYLEVCTPTWTPAEVIRVRACWTTTCSHSSEPGRLPGFARLISKPMSRSAGPSS